MTEEEDFEKALKELEFDYCKFFRSRGYEISDQDCKDAKAGTDFMKLLNAIAESMMATKGMEADHLPFVRILDECDVLRRQGYAISEKDCEDAKHEAEETNELRSLMALVKVLHDAGIPVSGVIHGDDGKALFFEDKKDTGKDDHDEN